MDFLDSLNSDLNTNLSIPESRQVKYNNKSEPEQKQRTEKWHNARIGRITGSKSKDLMSCTAMSKNMPWDAQEKVYDFGKGFKKVIYWMYMTTKHDTPFISRDAFNFRYGRIVEPFIISKLPSNVVFEECESIDIIHNIYSASPDGKIIGKNTGLIAAAEFKAAMDTDTVYNRIEENYDERHVDFWQTQSEMLALKATHFIYGTALPPRDMGEIMHLREDEDNIEILNELIPDVIFRTFEASKTHQEALLIRAEIAGKARDIKLQNENFSIDKCINEALKL